MKKNNSILSLSFDFTAKFIYEYVKYLLRYVPLIAIGVVLIFLTKINPIFALVALFVSVPAFCYSFWKGYVVTYALNYLALDFYLKKPLKPFSDYVKLAFEAEKELIKFVSFVAVIALLGFLPSIIYFIYNIPLDKLIIDPNTTPNYKTFIMISIITTVVFAQFMNFSLQAFFFDKKANYFALLINCYKTGFLGFLISNLIIGLTSFLNFKEPVIYFIVFLPLNLLIYSINLFWYCSKVKKQS